LATAAQVEQVVSAVPVQPPLAYCPAAQVEQVGHVSNGPLTRWRPAAQLPHCESLVPVQLRPAAQPTTGAQVVQLAVPLP
jgi:hypothetical protein